MGNSIKFKLGAILGAFVILVVGTIMATFITVNAQKSDAIVLNVSGAQRMLSQKMTKEAMSISAGLSDGDEVEATEETFEANLNALISGDSSRGIPATDDGPTLAQLNTVSTMWVDFKKNLNETTVNYEELETAEGFIAKGNLILLKEMNQAVGMMDKAGFSAHDVNLAGAQRMLSQKMAKEALEMASDPTKADTFMESVNKFDKVLNGFLKGDASLGIDAVKSAAIASQLNTVNDTWKGFKVHSTNLVGITKSLKKHTTFLMENNMPLLKAANKAVGMYEATSAGKVTSLKNMQLAILAVAVVVAIIGWLVIIRSIVNPVLEVVDLAETLASGDLSRDNLDIDSKDEIGSLADALNTMKTNLSGMIGQIQDTSDHISTATTELAATATQIVKGADKQSEQSNQVATSMEEMSATVVEVARNSQDSAENAIQTQTIAKKGSDIVTNAVNGMLQVAETVKVSATTVEALGKSSEQIGQIVGVINDIADQTNLLALNAAIEAARAGEQGRGFAVVADEVRKLAEKTTSATKEIAVMIKAIQDDTGGAISSMHEGTKQVDANVELAKEAGESLSQIVDSVEVVTDMVRQIATSAEEQSATSEEVSANVNGIAEISRETATGVRQVSSATEDLSKIADDLNRLTGAFVLKNNGRSAVN